MTSDLVPTDVVDAELICGDKLYSCHCAKLPDHDGAHACDPDACGGSWTYDDKGESEIVTLPHLGAAAAPFAFLFGSEDDQ